MAALTAKSRNKLADAKFADPASRSYPVENRAHAANAKARATQAVDAGRISKSMEAKIDRAADKVLAKKK